MRARRKGGQWGGVKVKQHSHSRGLAGIILQGRSGEEGSSALPRAKHLSLGRARYIGSDPDSAARCASQGHGRAEPALLRCSRIFAER